jgi:hypothetical protein
MTTTLPFTAEKDIEFHVRSKLETVTKAQFTSPENTDGVLIFDNVVLLFEAKLSANLTESQSRANVVAQALHYVHNLSTKPNTLLVADQWHYFALPTAMFEDVLSLSSDGVDWSCAPSSPCSQLVAKVSQHRANEAVFLQGMESFDAQELVRYCKELATNHAYKTPIAEANIGSAFMFFSEKVFTKLRYSSAEMVDVFLAVITRDDGDAYKHPKKPNTLVVDGRDYAVDLQAFDAFFSFYQRGYPPSTIDTFQAQRDRLLEDDSRRRQGAFYTPSLWTDEAHREMDVTLGENWRDECIVWDCCAGTGNLTRNYEFKNLILSTVELSDVMTIKREGYNEGAEIFQYDFLNPESDSIFVEDNNMPYRVKKLLRDGSESGKRLVFLINPPYATAGVKSEDSKKGVASTATNREMKDAKLGACSQQLYAQFLFQCEQVALEYGFKQKSVGVFCTPTFMVSGSFSKFRPFWYKQYAYQSGFMFQASHFADVSGVWGISFTLWSEGSTDVNQDLRVTLKDIVEGSVASRHDKCLYSSDTRKASAWVREPAKGLKTFDVPQMKSGLTLAPSGQGRSAEQSLCYLLVAGNNLQQACGLTGLFSTTFSSGHGTSVLAGEGWRRAIALFSARKLVKGNWVTAKDEYLAPQTDLDGYAQWVDDCHVYALLQSSNNMTAMRDIEYKGEKHNIHNHFFWLNKSDALNMYDSSESLASYRDCKKSRHTPYFAEVLPNLSLSPLAQELLDDLTEILRDPNTHKLRASADSSLHAISWDIGVYQLNKLLKDDTRWVTLKRKALLLRDQLSCGVYRYGFLKK